MEEVKKRPYRKRKPVRLIELNLTFESIAEAAEKTGIPRGAISDVCHGRRLGSYNNLHFEFINKESDNNE